MSLLAATMAGSRTPSQNVVSNHLVFSIVRTMSINNFWSRNKYKKKKKDVRVMRLVLYRSIETSKRDLRDNDHSKNDKGNKGRDKGD